VHLFPIATVADWRTASSAGAYTTSTRGVTLEQEGFIHAARRDQVGEVWRRYYADAAEPLVLLTIDTDRLGSPWQEDPVGETTFPHIYGAVDVSAVVRVQPLDARGGTGSFTATFVREMFVRMGLFVGAMGLAVVGAAVGRHTAWDWGTFAGAVLGLCLGVALMAALLRRRGRPPRRHTPS
jgi:uncharacterized protein (DUF952 family)